MRQCQLSGYLIFRYQISNINSDENCHKWKSKETSINKNKFKLSIASPAPPSALSNIT